MASKMSNFEWGFFLGVLAFIDFVQFMLDFIVIGLILNRFIDVGVGFAMPFYLKQRGVNLDKKKIGGMVIAFLLEQIPLLDALPLWTLDGAITMILDKRDKTPEPEEDNSKVIDIQSRKKTPAVSSNEERRAA